jgi:hypothetical protein
LKRRGWSTPEAQPRLKHKFSARGLEIFHLEFGTFHRSKGRRLQTSRNGSVFAHQDDRVVSRLFITWKRPRMQVPGHVERVGANECFHVVLGPFFNNPHADSTAQTPSHRSLSYPTTPRTPLSTHHLASGRLDDWTCQKLESEQNSMACKPLDEARIASWCFFSMAHAFFAQSRRPKCIPFSS